MFRKDEWLSEKIAKSVYQLETNDWSENDFFQDWKEFNSDFSNMIPDGEYETIGGYIISYLGRIPNKGEHLFMPIGQIVVIKASVRQIHQIQIYPAE